MLLNTSSLDNAACDCCWFYVSIYSHQPQLLLVLVAVNVVVSHVHQIIHLQASPGDIADMEDYHDEATENPMYQTYTLHLH